MKMLLWTVGKKNYTTVGAASRARGGQGAGGHVSRERRRRQAGCGHARGAAVPPTHGCCWGPVTVATGSRASGHRRGNPGRARGNHLSMRRHHRPQLDGSAIAVASSASGCPSGRHPQPVRQHVRSTVVQAAGRKHCSRSCAAGALPAGLLLHADGTMAAQSLVLMHDHRRHRTSGAGRRTCTPRGVVLTSAMEPAAGGRWCSRTALVVTRTEDTTSPASDHGDQLVEARSSAETANNFP